MNPIKPSFLFIAYCSKNYALKCIENQANPTEACSSWLSVIYSLPAMANITWTALKHAIARRVKYTPTAQHTHLLLTKTKIMSNAALKPLL